MEPARSHRNRAVVEAARLHRSRVRRERGETLLEGTILLEEALAAGVTIRTVFHGPDDRTAAELASDHGAEPVLVTERALQRLAGTDTPRGPVAVMAIPQGELRPARNVLVAWGVSDPGNVGTLIRTAAAFDWDYAYTEGSADPWSPKALRAGSGGQFHVSVARVGAMTDLESWVRLAMVVEGGNSLGDVSGAPLALLIGEEAAGLPDEIVAASEEKVTVPMPGRTESLNAAIAAAIALYELSKPRGHAGGRV